MLSAFLLAATIQGPSSTSTPYVVPVAPEIGITSILTVGDGVGDYRLAGVDDGLGAFDNFDGTFTLLVNHELAASAGKVRAHGERGAFISKWIIRKSDLAVVRGEDLIRRVARFNHTTHAYDAPAAGVVMQRFCSADLPPIDAFYDSASGAGFFGRIFMNGEEVANGRAFAHLLDGTSYELPRLGRMHFENAVTNPKSGAKTIVAGLNDVDGGQLFVYIGTKTATGSPIERAGLTNGVLYGVKVSAFPFESAESGIPSGASFTLHALGNVEDLSDAVLAAAADGASVTKWRRPEDGAWDPVNVRDFYFATTASLTTKSRLWRLHFDDLAHPEAGGHVDMLLDGTEGPKNMDNLTITRRGEIFIEEDPGGDPRLARIWRYAIPSDHLMPVAEHDPVRFGLPGAITNAEEASGIIDASAILGDGWLLFTSQAHFVIPGEFVEGGQLLAMHFPTAPRKRRN